MVKIEERRVSQVGIFEEEVRGNLYREMKFGDVWLCYKLAPDECLVYGLRSERIDIIRAKQDLGGQLGVCYLIPFGVLSYTEKQIVEVLLQPVHNKQVRFWV